MTAITQTLPITLSPELDFDQNAASTFGHSLASSYVQATPFPQ
ncbi:2OG-Fe(II) oxygenase, partial [Pseudomonas neuropathica]